ncbi:hypothetical protein BH23ACT9_BH23ACT9_22600 [soil metagenome]
MTGSTSPAPGHTGVCDRFEPCLLTDDELAGGEDDWLALPDPMAPCPPRYRAPGHPAARWRVD